MPLQASCPPCCPQAPLAHNNLGVALTEADQWDQAINELQEALRLDPNLAIVHRNLGEALQVKGRLGESINTRSRSASTPRAMLDNRPCKPPDAAKPGNRVTLRLAEGACAANPPDHEAWFGYAELCLFLGEEAEYRRARRLARPLRRGDRPSSPTNWPCLPAATSSENELRQADRAHRPQPVAAGSNDPPHTSVCQGFGGVPTGPVRDAIAHDEGGAARVMGPAPALSWPWPSTRRARKTGHSRHLRRLSSPSTGVRRRRTTVIPPGSLRCSAARPRR